MRLPCAALALGFLATCGDPQAPSSPDGAAGGVTGSGGATGSGGSSGGAGGSTAPGRLPEGDSGIAARHPGDVGIGDDPVVIFADDFESYAKAADLDQRWDNKYQNQYISLATTAANVFAGKQALEFTLPQQDAELSDAVEKVVSPELDDEDDEVGK